MTIYKIFSSCVCVKISRRRWTLTRAWLVSQSVESTRKTKANTLAWPTTNWVATLHPPASSSMVYNHLLPSFVFFLVFYSFSFPCNFVNNKKKKTIEPIKIMSGRLFNFFNQFDCCCLTFDIFYFFNFANTKPVADDKENDLMVQLDSRPAGTVSARATPRTTPRTTPSRTIRSLSPINSSNKQKITFSEFKYF